MFHNMKNQKIIGKQDQSDYRDRGKWKGSIVVEASYLMPFTLVLYGIIILIAAVLLVRCLSSQNRFLQVWQGERYTSLDTLEVIYADRESS
mgnify:FL=1